MVNMVSCGATGQGVVYLRNNMATYGAPRGIVSVGGKVWRKVVVRCGLVGFGMASCVTAFAVGRRGMPWYGVARRDAPG